jgi:hypothetical protein
MQMPPYRLIEIPRLRLLDLTERTPLLCSSLTILLLPCAGCSTLMPFRTLFGGRSQLFIILIK